LSANKSFKGIEYFRKSCDYLKDKGIATESKHKNFWMMYVFKVGQFAGDRGKRLPKEVGEEKGKRKRLHVEREKEEKTQTRRRSSETAARSCKSESCYTGPVQVGKTDLNPKKAAAVAAPVNSTRSSAHCRKSGST
jgi:translation initiation factor IF-2